MPTLAGKTLFISGASRGIGLAIALRAARDGANIVIAAKTDTPHPKLPGTIHTAAAEIAAAGGPAARGARRPQHLYRGQDRSAASKPARTHPYRRCRDRGGGRPCTATGR